MIVLLMPPVRPLSFSAASEAMQRGQGMTSSARSVENIRQLSDRARPELADRARPANEQARLCGKIERYRSLLGQFRHDRKTRHALRAEIAELEDQLAQSKP